MNEGNLSYLHLEKKIREQIEKAKSRETEDIRKKIENTDEDNKNKEVVYKIN